MHSLLLSRHFSSKNKWTGSKFTGQKGRLQNSTRLTLTGKWPYSNISKVIFSELHPLDPISSLSYLKEEEESVILWPYGPLETWPIFFCITHIVYTSNPFFFITREKGWSCRPTYIHTYTDACAVVKRYGIYSYRSLTNAREKRKIKETHYWKCSFYWCRRLSATSITRCYCLIL